MTSKSNYRKMNIEDLNPSKENEAWSAKIDGAHTIIKMKPGKIPEHFSHRISKRTGEQIEYTQKLPHIKNKALYNAEIRGETYAVTPDGKAIHRDVVTALLNSGLQKSLALQKNLDIKTTTALIDVDKFNGKDMRNAPFAEKRKVLESIIKANPEYHLPDTAYTPKEKQKLLKSILSKRHLQTSEGIVVHDLTGEGKAFTKAKVIDHHDVYITGIFPEENVKEGRKPMAGGFTYSWEPDGKTVGKVGTGFNHSEKEDMMKNPNKYIGRAAKVKALDVSKNKVLVKPSFDGWHVEKNIGVEKMAMYKEEIEKLSVSAKNNPLKDPYFRHSLGHVTEDNELDVDSHKKHARETNRIIHSILERAYNEKHLSRAGKAKYYHLTADLKYSPNKRVMAHMSSNDFTSKKLADKYSQYFDALYNNKLERDHIEKMAAKKPRPKVYAVDFDGTIVENAFPRIGKLKPETVDFIKRVHGRGDKVIVWTSRGQKHLENMEKFLTKNDVPFHEINQNSSFYTGSPKIVADYYIDDKAVHVSDIDKIAMYKEEIKKKAAYPSAGMVKRTMSGLTQSKVVSAAPVSIKNVKGTTSGVTSSIKK